MEMVMGKKVVILMMVMMVAICGETRGFDLCNMNEDGLAACKPSVTELIPVNPPSSECCKALSGADLTCLCSYKDSAVLPTLGIDPNLALGLPSKCGLTPPANC